MQNQTIGKAHWVGPFLYPGQNYGQLQLTPVSKGNRMIISISNSLGVGYRDPSSDSNDINDQFNTLILVVWILRFTSTRRYHVLTEISCRRCGLRHVEVLPGFVRGLLCSIL